MNVSSKIVLIFLIGILALTMVSAADWKTNIVGEKKIRIMNETKVKADYTLVYSDYFCSERCVAIVDINGNVKEKLFDKVQFKNKNLDAVDLKDFDITIYEKVEENIDVACHALEGCSTKEETITRYVEVDKYSKLKKAEYRIEIIGNIEGFEKIDWVMSAFGFDFDEWEWWHNSLDWNDDFNVDDSKTWDVINDTLWHFYGVGNPAAAGNPNHNESQYNATDDYMRLWTKAGFSGTGALALAVARTKVNLNTYDDTYRIYNITFSMDGSSTLSPPKEEYMSVMISNGTDISGCATNYWYDPGVSCDGQHLFYMNDSGGKVYYQLIINSSDRNASISRNGVFSKSIILEDDESWYVQFKNGIIAAYGEANQFNVYNYTMNYTDYPAPLNVSIYTTELKEGLIGHWPLDETDGSNASDSTGYNELENNNSIQQGTYGKLGTSYNFTTDKYLFNLNPINGGTTNRSGCFWFNTPTTATNHNTLYFGDAAGDNLRFIMNVRASAKVLATTAGAANDLTSTGTYDANRWTFYCAVLEDTNLTIYLDGAVDSSKTVTNSITDDILAVGVSSAFTGSYEGRLDEVSIWNRSLSDAEVNLLYNSGEGLYYDYPAGTAPHILTEAFTYNATSYETATEDYIYNITYNDSRWTSDPTATFTYNGTSYGASTASGGSGSMGFSNQLGLSSSEIGNNTFYWTVGFTNATGTYYSNSTEKSQDVNSISFGYCNASLTVPYLNFTFKDESDDSDLNASNDETSLSYHMGNASAAKSFISSNATENPSYAFCGSPPDRAITVTDFEFKYSASGYPLRTFADTSEVYTNTTTDTTLYLLGTADGIYSSYTVIETSGSPIDGVNVDIERQFSGVWTIVGTGVTGGDGTVTFWVNPNFQHRVTASKTGYVTSQVTITPSQSLYTLTLQQTTGNATYTSDFPGITYEVYPFGGEITPGSRNFNVTIDAANDNLENCKFDLLNATNISQVLATVTNLTNVSHCFLSITYTAIEDDNIFGRISVDTTETTGFVILASDWRFFVVDRVTEDWRGIKGFFSELRDIGEFGEGNKATYSRLMFFFLISTILIGIFVFFTGVEIGNSGVSLILIWVLVVLASAGGFLTFESGSTGVNTKMAQYGYAWVYTMLVGSYFLRAMRREME